MAFFRDESSKVPIELTGKDNLCRILCVSSTPTTAKGPVLHRSSLGAFASLRMSGSRRVGIIRAACIGQCQFGVPFVPRLTSSARLLVRFPKRYAILERFVPRLTLKTIEFQPDVKIQPVFSDTLGAFRFSALIHVGRAVTSEVKYGELPKWFDSGPFSCP